MRFSIRDLLWLTALVALAATICTDRLRVARLQQKWAEEKTQIHRETAEALSAMESKVTTVRIQNLMQEHRFNVQLEAERRLHHRELARLRTEAARLDLRKQHVATPAVPIELAGDEPK